MSTIAPRIWPGTEPGFDFLASAAPGYAADRIATHAEWRAITGLALDDCFASILTSEPCPRLDPSLTTGLALKRRFHGLTVTAMRHPIMWAAPLSARRSHVMYETTDGAIMPALWIDPELIGGQLIEVEEETDAELALRLMIEVAATGLYDPAEGAWVDMLELWGITDPVDADRRVTAWFAGATDPILDAIRLPGHAEAIGWGIRSGIGAQMALAMAAGGLQHNAGGDRIDILGDLYDTYGDRLTMLTAEEISTGAQSEVGAQILAALTTHLASPARWTTVTHALAVPLAVRSWALNCERILERSAEVNRRAAAVTGGQDVIDLLTEMSAILDVCSASVGAAANVTGLDGSEWSTLSQTILAARDFASFTPVGRGALDRVLSMFVTAEARILDLHTWCTGWLAAEQSGAPLNDE